MRRLHSIVALAASVIVCFMAVTGLLLALQPILDAAALTGGGDLSVATIAAHAAENVPGIERLVRYASGLVVAYGFDGTAHTADLINPATGVAIAPYAPSPFFSFVTELHRSFFLGDMGRAGAALASLAMVGLAVSGAFLLVAKLGGWRALLRRSRGDQPQRLHSDLARVVAVVLLLTGLTGAYMGATYFELVPSGPAETLSFPPMGAGTPAQPIATLSGLAATPLPNLRELVFPAAGDPSDVFTMTTTSGKSYVDPSTGEVLSEEPNTAWQQVYELVYLLHTGNGVWMLALVLGGGALSVPVLAVTGLIVWWSRRRKVVRIDDNASPRDASVVIVVGSESGTTWGFAATLQQGLRDAGMSVHLAPMNELRTDYPKAVLLLILTATYGDGQAPASANRFLARLGKLRSRPAFAVLGFGDRSFPAFCAFSAEVEAALSARGLASVLPTYGINRQSASEFRAWGELLGDELAMPLDLIHQHVTPRTRRYELVEREAYGVEIQAPIVVLRFRPAARAADGSPTPWWQSRLPPFEVGDLLGIVPPASPLPRYYSLASARRDGVIEICVRSQAGGLCSGFLHGLEPGEAIEAFVRPNREFRPERTRRPLILIGAGSGVAPLVGFIRHNHRHQPVHLFLGARDPRSDFLYRDEIEEALGDGRLTSLTTAFSRVFARSYVQHELAADAERLRQLITQGAQIMVCGGRDMALGARETIDTCLAPLALSVDELKRNGRYLEDAY